MRRRAFIIAAGIIVACENPPEIPEVECGYPIFTPTQVGPTAVDTFQAQSIIDTTEGTFAARKLPRANLDARLLH